MDGGGVWAFIIMARMGGGRRKRHHCREQDSNKPKRKMGRRSVQNQLHLGSSIAQKQRQFYGAAKPEILFRENSERRRKHRKGGKWVFGGRGVCNKATFVREKQKLLARIRRIKGQVEAIERALDGEAGCEQVMHLIAGARGAMAGLMAEVVEDHVRTHLVDAEKHPNALNGEAAEQLLDVVRTYLK
jgi:DNA-binding FrmR family transcriptional regulator